MNNLNHVLKVSQWTRNDYTGFDVLELWQRESDGKQYYSTALYEDKGNRTQAIRLYCQANLYPISEKDSYTYAWRIEALENRVTNQNLEDIKQAIKRIEKIQKGYDKLVIQFGIPRDFTMFVSYIAKVLNAAIVEESPFDNEAMSLLDIETLRWRENKMVKNIQE